MKLQMKPAMYSLQFFFDIQIKPVVYREVHQPFLSEANPSFAKTAGAWAWRRQMAFSEVGNTSISKF